jgi:S-DNA-T family DNA segregation ATPase FtsK/SpoIIIE
MPPRRPGRRVPRHAPSRAAAILHAARARWPLALAVLLLGSGGILGLALVFPSGRVSLPLSSAQRFLLGWTAPLIAVWLTVAGALVLQRYLQPATRLPSRQLVGGGLASGGLVGLAGLVSMLRSDGPEALDSGGLLGWAIARALTDALGPLAAGLLLALALLAGIALGCGVSPLALVRRAWQLVRRGQALVAAAVQRCRRRPDLVRPLARRRELRAASRGGTPAGVSPRGPVHDAARGDAGPLATPPPRSPWRLPPLSLLAAPASATLAPVDLQQRARIIEETLASFHIDARVVEINEGPTVTQFGVEPGVGVTVNRITARANDLALRLGATSLRIEAPVPGKRVVGIEVPNAASAIVTLREILATPEFERLASRLGLALGRDVAGRPVVADLTRMPHLLIAGATGSGKSVCINGIIACLLMQCTPDDLQLLLVDPKMVELAPYEGIPHLRLPVVTEMDKVVGVLKWALQEMERRYALFAKHGVRNIESFNRTVAGDDDRGRGRTGAGPVRAAPPQAKPLPYLVIVIDELADLMMTTPDEVELCLTRLAQKARATGIHLIVATQRPSVDVVTGLIKANFPTRIAFAVTSQVDSRVILDTVGAEKLLGRGDMLYLPAEAAKPIRVQGNYVSDAEIEALVRFWRAQGAAEYDTTEIAAVEALSARQDDGVEELVERAIPVVREHKRVSVSLLQRRLGIGYPRAARLLDLLAERGVVQPAEDGRSWVAAEPAAESADAS